MATNTVQKFRISKSEKTSQVVVILPGDYDTYDAAENEIMTSDKLPEGVYQVQKVFIRTLDEQAGKKGR